MSQEKILRIAEKLTYSAPEKTTEKAVKKLIAGLTLSDVYLLIDALDKAEQDANGRYQQEVGEACAAGSDPQLADFYDNEVRAASRGLAKTVSAIKNSRDILRKIGEERELKPAEVEKVRSAIYSNMKEDDREPREVVETDFAGDWNKYYKRMARWFDIHLDPII